MSLVFWVVRSGKSSCRNECASSCVVLLRTCSSLVAHSASDVVTGNAPNGSKSHWRVIALIRSCFCTGVNGGALYNAWSSVVWNQKMGTLCTTFEAHVAPTPTSKRAPFPWHWPITKHHSTLALTRRSVKRRCIKVSLNSDVWCQNFKCRIDFGTLHTENLKQETLGFWSILFKNVLQRQKHFQNVEKSKYAKKKFDVDVDVFNFKRRV